MKNPYNFTAVSKIALDYIWKYTIFYFQNEENYCYEDYKYS